ncbi:MAG: response regulator transcription factor, partial [Bacteroidota bacterium]
QYAVQAFQIHAIDYLLKPFTDERFYDCLKHAKERLHQESTSTLDESYHALIDGYRERQSGEKDQMILSALGSADQRMLIKSGGKIHFIDFSEIRWIEAFDYYVKVHTADRFFLVRESMKKMEVKLSPHNFIRIHKSSIINLDFIKELEPYFNGEYYVKLKEGEKLKLSRTYKKHLLGRLGM